MLEMHSPCVCSWEAHSEHILHSFDLGHDDVEWNWMWNEIECEKDQDYDVLQVTHNESPVTPINYYWRNCTEGFWWPYFIRSDLWFKMTFEKHLRLVSRAAFQRLGKKVLMCSLLWPGASQWIINYHRMWVQLPSTCSNVLKQPNGKLLVAVNHNQLRTMASETVDLIDWSHPPPSSAVPPERPPPHAVL